MQDSVRRDPPPEFRLSDPRIIWAFAALALVAMLIISRPIVLVLVTVLVIVTATSSFVGVIQRATSLSYARAAGLFSAGLLLITGIVLWFTVPLLIQGIRDINASIPKDAQWWHSVLEAVRDELEAVVPASMIDAIIASFQHGPAGAATASAGAKILHFVEQVTVHGFLGIVFYLLLLSQWDDIRAGIDESLGHAFPRQAQEARWLARRFEHNLGNIRTAVLKVMAICIPFYTFVYWILGMPIGKASVYGFVSGAIGGLPVIGGVLMHIVMWPIGFWEFVIPTFSWSPEVLQSTGAYTWYLMVGILLAGHFLEAKFISTKIIGDHVQVKAIFILLALMFGALSLGFFKGLVLGFGVIALASALYDLYKHRIAMDAEALTIVRV